MSKRLAFVPRIIEMGADALPHGITQERRHRPVLAFGLRERPGVYELPMGTPLHALIYEHGGGIADDRKLKAVIPGGSSSHILTAAECEGLKLDFESVAAARFHARQRRRDGA